MRQLIQDAHAELLRALRNSLGERTGDLPILTITGLTAEPWASATFSGHRHRVEVRLGGHPEEVAEARDRIAARLPQLDFDLRDHLMASIELTGEVTTTDGDETVCELCFDALTIEA